MHRNYASLVIVGLSCVCGSAKALPFGNAVASARRTSEVDALFAIASVGTRPLNDLSANVQDSSEGGADLEPVAGADAAASRKKTALDPIRIGVMVGTGLPNLLNFGALLNVTRYFGVGINVGLIPKLRVSYYGDATLSFQEYDAFARVYPFGGGFFIGTGLGYATIRGTVTGTFDTSPYASQIPPGVVVPDQLTYESRGFVRTMVLTPRLGYFHVTSIGFSFGADVGIQIPVAPSTIEFRSNLALPPDTPEAIGAAARSQLLDPNDQKVRESLETVGRTPIPTVSLRLGWMI